MISKKKRKTTNETSPLCLLSQTWKKESYRHIFCQYLLLSVLIRIGIETKWKRKWGFFCTFLYCKDGWWCSNRCCPCFCKVCSRGKINKCTCAGVEVVASLFNYGWTTFYSSCRSREHLHSRSHNLFWKKTKWLEISILFSVAKPHGSLNIRLEQWLSWSTSVLSYRSSGDGGGTKKGKD